MSFSGVDFLKRKEEHLGPGLEISFSGILGSSVSPIARPLVPYGCTWRG